MFLLNQVFAGITAGFVSLTVGSRGEAPRSKQLHAKQSLIPSRLELRRRTPKSAPRWVTAFATPPGNGGGSSYGGNLSMDGNETGGRNDYWRGNASGSGGTRGRGGRVGGDESRTGGRGRGRGDGNRTYGSSRAQNSDGRRRASNENYEGGSDNARGGGRGGGQAGYSGGNAQPGYNSSTRSGRGRGRGDGNGTYRGSNNSRNGGYQKDVEAKDAAANKRKQSMRTHTGVISKAEKCEEVLEYCDANVHMFTAVNFSTAIHKLGKLNRNARGRRTSMAAKLIHDPRYIRLETFLNDSLILFADDDTSKHPTPNEFRGAWGTREICCVLWGFANCGRTAEQFGDVRECGHAPVMFSIVLKRLATFSGSDFSSQNLSNAIWALAKMHSGNSGQNVSGQGAENQSRVRQATVALKNAITDRLTNPPRGDAFIPQGVSNSFWALAVLEKHESNVSFQSDGVESQTEDFGLSQLSADAFSDYILDSNAYGFKSMELSNIIWAISTSRAGMKEGVSDVLNQAVCDACDDAPHMFSTQSVANILWAAGNTPDLVPLSTQVLDKLAKMTYSKFGEFTTQGLANTLWGFAGSNYNPGEGLFSEIRRAWIQKGDSYSIIELNNMLWAMHTLKENPGRGVFNSVHKRIADLCDQDAQKESQELTFNHVANFMYHMAQYEELPEPRTMQRLEQTLLRKIAIKGGQKLTGPADQRITFSNQNMADECGYQTSESLRKFGDRQKGKNIDVGYGFEVDSETIEKAAMSITPHLVSNTLWALSALKYKPGKALQAAFDGLVEQSVDLYTDQSLSMTVFAYANLAMTPALSTLQKIVAECEQRVSTGKFTAQGLANSFWGWAVLAYNPSSKLFDAYAKRFEEMANDDKGDGLSRVDLVQIYQASLAFEHCVEDQGTGELHCDVSESPKDSKNNAKRQLLKGALLRRAKEVWEQTSTGRVTISTLHREVSETLTLMGIPHEIEMLADDNFSLDIALRGRRVAIEVDGPSHFFANKPSEYMGADLLREKVLKVKGWKVLRLPWHEWREDYSTDERCDYLANLLYVGAGLTVKDASIVPGGVKMSGRVDDTSDPFRGNTAEGSQNSNADEPISGMAAYVQKAVSSPNQNVRINRSGSVIVEDATVPDDEAKSLRNSENVPRLQSKPDAKAGYSDGGYDLSKRQEKEFIRKSRLDGDIVSNLPDVAPYGITLEPGVGRQSAWRRVNGEERQPKRRKVSGDSSTGDVRTSDSGDTGDTSRKPSTPNRAASVRRRASVTTPSSSSSSTANQSGKSGAPPLRVPVRRRRVRISVPSQTKFGGGSVAKKSTTVDSSPESSPDTSNPASSVSSSKPSENSSWSSNDASNSDKSSVGKLRGVGAKSVERLEKFGVRTVGELAALSDSQCAGFLKNEKTKVKVLRQKAIKALKEQ